MLALFKIITFVYLVFFSLHSSSFEIRSLAKINNYTITNYDLFLEIKTQEILKNTKINDMEKKLLLQNLINEKIKELETNKLNLIVSDTDVNNRFNEIIKNLNNKSLITEEIEVNLKTKIRNSLKWNRLILIKFRNKIDINIKEIEQISKNERLNLLEKDRIINQERNKKLNVFSKTFYNEIKRNYLIKIY